jgi:hypothetical protein
MWSSAFRACLRRPLVIVVRRLAAALRPIDGSHRGEDESGSKLPQSKAYDFLPVTKSFRLALLFLCCLSAFADQKPSRIHAQAESESRAAPAVEVLRFLPVKPLSRALRPAGVGAVVRNTGDATVDLEVSLTVPEGVSIGAPGASIPLHLDDADEQEVRWEVEAAEAKAYELRVEVAEGAAPVASATLRMEFLEPLPIQPRAYIPEPEPVKTRVLIGAHHCPLWEADKPQMWSQLLKHPERTPALGFYAQENPEVSDWETKWATEHGVGFFIYCWYRAGQGGPVKMNFGSAIHDALFKSKFVDRMKFTIMWENQSRGQAGVSDENDLMTNLLPFWIENYFKHPGYVKIDNQPLLFIYRPEFLIDDLGGEENVVKAFGLMRQACREAGFDGLYLLGEYRGLDPEHLKLMKRLGLDYTFAYCWHVPDSPAPQQAIDAQVNYINKTRELGILPQVVTVSQGWSGWKDEGSIWTLPPPDYKILLDKAKEIIATFPAAELGSKLLLLDNWNEWGEGHFIAPYRQYGFGYLDAVREVFAEAPGPHTDLLPEDIGMGPYDAPYRAHMLEEQTDQKLRSKKVFKTGAPEDGLIGWWAFDEAPGSPVALDYSGNRLGGRVLDATRAPGIDGNALVCESGCAAVNYSPLLSPGGALTIECWVKTDLAGQGNAWFVNRVFGGGISTGYRMGVLDGHPCFEVPLTDWSHHLKAREPLPTGRWVHLVGTFDGNTERIYVDGEEQGAMERPGPVNPNEFYLCLGNFDRKHAAYFTGLLDEVKLYRRALTPEEIQQHYRALASPR